MPRRLPRQQLFESGDDDRTLMGADLVGVARDVRGGDDVGQGQQRILGTGWLNGEDVERGPA